MSDDGELINFPAREGGLSGMPGLPPPRRSAPEETPEETTMELPVIPERESAADSAAAVMAAEAPMPGLPGTVGSPPAAGHGGAGALIVAAPLAVALAAMRGMATAVSDWRQRRMAEHAEAAPLREARMKAKVAGLEQKAEHALAMKKLGDQASQARAKSSVPSSQEYGRKAGGSGGGRGPTGSGSSGGSGRGSGAGSGGGKGSGAKSSGASGSGKEPGKGPGGKGAGPSGAGKGTGASSGSGKGPGSGGKGSGASSGSGSGKGSGSGAKGSGSGGKGSGVQGPTGGKSPSSSASSPSMERARGRQERKAADGAARAERRSARQAANLADRTKDRDLARDNRQNAREARRAAKEARRKDKAEKAEKKTAAAKDGEDRTTLGQAAVKAARRRWKKRRKRGMDPPVFTKAKKRKKKPKPSSGTGTGSGPGTGKPPKSPSGKRGAGKKAGTTSPGSGRSKPTGGKKGRAKKSRVKGSKWNRKTGSKPGSGGSGTTGSAGSRTTGSAGPGPGAGSYTREDAWTSARKATGPIRDPFLWVRDDQPKPKPKPPAAVTTGQRGLPPAPEPHTKRPGTQRPGKPRRTTTPKGHMKTVETRSSSGLAARHRTELTLDAYLLTMVRIAMGVLESADEAELVATTMQKAADVIVEAQQDLQNSHNVTDAKVQALLDNTAQAAKEMAAEAQRMAIRCRRASDGSQMAARVVNADYRRDQVAKHDAGLKHVSSATHHEG